MVNIYECKSCKNLVERGVKGEERIIGTRKKIRKHLTEEHHIKGRKNITRLTKKGFGKSEITENTISEEWK